VGRESERKFLITDDSWKALATGIKYRQGYLPCGKGIVVRIRTAGDKGFLTIKGKGEGLLRKEYEYEIPLAEAEELLDEFCEKPLIEKYRYRILYRDSVWEIDEFLGENAGLIIAEVEVTNEKDKLPLPPWVGKEVTEDPRYLNINLVRNPYTKWAVTKG